MTLNETGLSPGGVAVVMKTTSAFPAEPVVEFCELSEPPLATQETWIPGTRFPNASTMRTLIKVLAPATSDVESAVAGAIAFGAPGVEVAVRLTEPVPAVAVSVLTRAVSLNVHVIDALPLASVVDVLALTVPLP